MIACYQLGYGIAAFGAGRLHASGVTLPTIDGASTVVAIALWAASLRVTRTGRGGRAVHEEAG